MAQFDPQSSLRSRAGLLACALLVACAEKPVLVSQRAQSRTVRTHEPSEPAEAAGHREACQRGDAAACHAAALDAYYAPSSPVTDRDALLFFQRACDAGYAPSCNGLGLLFAEGRGTPADAGRAAELYRASCLAGASTGCEHLAQALKQGRGVARDEAAARRASARARCVFKASLASASLAGCPAL